MSPDILSSSKYLGNYLIYVVASIVLNLYLRLLLCIVYPRGNSGVILTTVWHIRDEFWGFFLSLFHILFGTRVLVLDILFGFYSCQCWFCGDDIPG